MSALLSVLLPAPFLQLPFLGVKRQVWTKNYSPHQPVGSVIGYVLFGLAGALWFYSLLVLLMDSRQEYQYTVCLYIRQTRTQERSKCWIMGAAMGIGKLGGQH